jgi:hypothetical protein
MAAIADDVRSGGRSIATTLVVERSVKCFSRIGCIVGPA